MASLSYAKPPVGGPGPVLKYLARYTHRVAIANRRLLALEDGRVTFWWKDYAHGNRQRLMTLDAVEFIRRFLLHILPVGFQRLRQYGLLANRGRQAKLRLCRVLLQQPVSPTRAALIAFSFPCEVPRAASAAGEPHTACVSSHHSGFSTRPAGGGVSGVPAGADVLGGNPPPSARPRRQVDAATGLGYFLIGQRDGQIDGYPTYRSLEAST